MEGSCALPKAPLLEGLESAVQNAIEASDLLRKELESLRLRRQQQWRSILEVVSVPKAAASVPEGKEGEVEAERDPDKSEGGKRKGGKERRQRLDRQAIEEVGDNVVVRKHSFMGCAVVSMRDPRVREAILRQGGETIISSIRVQMQPHTDKDKKVDVPTDIFVAWGRQVEKLTPLSERDLMEHFDQKHREITEIWRADAEVHAGQASSSQARAASNTSAKAVKEDGRALKFCSETLRNDKDVAMEAVKNRGKALEFCSQELRSDKDVVMEAVKRDAFAIKYCSETLRNDKDVAIEAVKWNGEALQYCSQELRSDKDFVIEAVNRNAVALQYCSQELRSDKDVVMKALATCQYRDVPKGFKLLSEEVRNNKELAIEAVKQNGSAIKYFSENLRNDKEVAIQVVKQFGGAFQHFSEKLRDDKEVALEAVKGYGSALKFCSETLRNDKTVATMAVKQYAFAIKYCSETLLNDKDLAIEAVKQNVGVVKYFSQELRNDKDIMMEAVKQNGRFLELCSETLRNDKDVAMEAVKKWRLAIKHCSETLRNDKDVAIEAIKKWGFAIKHCSETLRNDKDVVLEALTSCGAYQVPDIVKLISKELQNNNEVAMQAVKKNGEALQYCSQELRNDKDVVMEAARQAPASLKFASKELKKDRDCLQAAGLMRELGATTDKRPEKGIFSVKFGFNESASHLSTVVAEDLANHPSNFDIYNPNLFCKQSCDPNFTAMSWPCRGTEATCTLEKEKKTTDVAGKPTDDSCWRLSFHYHQAMCKKANGFMLQLEEHDKLGAGQEIETLMAESLDLKTFRFKWDHDDRRLTTADPNYRVYRYSIANQLADTVLDWLDNETRDTTMQIIKADIEYRSERFGNPFEKHPF